MLLVAIRAKNILPARWQMVLGLTGRVANRYAVVMVCETGEKYFARTLMGGVGDDGRVANRACGVAGCVSGEKYFAPTLVGGVGLTRRVANRVCGIAGCDSGEKYFAPTLIGGVEADWLGCEQGMRW